MIDLPSTGSFIALLAAELREVKRTALKRSFRAGQVIFKQGDVGDGLYVVESGSVEISTMINEEETRVLSRLGDGTFFGEMSVLDEQPRSATAMAAVNSVVSFIPREELVLALRRSPELLAALLKEFSLRMRQFDRRFVDEILQAERLTLIGRFAQSIVHDFKNPLNIIGWAAELPPAEGASAEHRAEAKDQITRQVGRMTNMINELLEFTRGTSRSAVLVPTDYRKFVENFLKEMIPEAGEKSVKIECENPPPALVLALDGDRLHHVFCNLVNNAIDVMPDGGTITLRFSVRDGEAVTEIEDTGPGFAPEIVARLFQPFATHGKAHGTGLGLSICKRIVEDHRATSMRTASGARRVFSIMLPLPAA